MGSIGIFAGTFDPVHDGHLAVAESGLEHLSLDAVYFLVEKKPWSNKDPVDVEHRKRMVRAATESSMKIQLLEINEERFTVDKTLPKLQNMFAHEDLYFIMGADVFMRMNHQEWPYLDKLLQHYVVVFERGEVSEAAITAHAKELGIVVAVLPTKHPHHRSTDVRLHADHSYIWIPKKVASYIESEGLYDH